MKWPKRHWRARDDAKMGKGASHQLCEHIRLRHNLDRIQKKNIRRSVERLQETSFDFTLMTKVGLLCNTKSHPSMLIGCLRSILLECGKKCQWEPQIAAWWTFLHTTQNMEFAYWGQKLHIFGRGLFPCWDLNCQLG